MNSFMEGLLGIIGFIIIGIIFSFPLIIAAIMNNWWFMFLYFVSWIPTFVFGVLIKAFID